MSAENDDDDDGQIVHHQAIGVGLYVAYNVMRSKRNGKIVYDRTFVALYRMCLPWEKRDSVIVDMYDQAIDVKEIRE